MSIGTTVANNDVVGNPKSGDSGILVEEAHHTTVVNNDVRNVPEGEIAIEAVESIDTTIAGNDLKGNYLGVFLEASTGTKAHSNDMSHTGLVGIFVRGQKSADAKVVGNDISGGMGHLRDGHLRRHPQRLRRRKQSPRQRRGHVLRRLKSQPVGDFKVTGNTVQNNTRSCRGLKFGRKFSGIGIALLGAREMEVTGNHLSGNLPSGPTAVSGGVVVSTNPYFRGTAEPRNNSIIGNRFGRNKPDIFWDGSGTGNRFVGNLCNTSVPIRLCN